MSKNFKINEWKDKHIKKGMKGREERKDNVV